MKRLKGSRTERSPSRPLPPRSSQEILRWWESRRLLFNLIICPAGFLAFVLLSTVTASAIHLPEGEDMAEPCSVVLVPFLLNALYCMGAAVESALARTRASRTGRLGPVLFALGTAAILLLMAWVVLWPFLLPGSVAPATAPSPGRDVPGAKSSARNPRT